MGRLGKLVALSLLIGGLAVLAEAAATGQAHVAVVLIVPVIYGSSLLLGAGVLLVALGFLAFVFTWGEFEVVSAPAPGAPPTSPTPPGSGPAVGGFLLLGPLPIVYGNRPGWMPYLVLLAVVVLLALVVAALLLAGGGGTVLVP